MVYIGSSNPPPFCFFLIFSDSQGDGDNDPTVQGDCGGGGGQEEIPL